MSDLSLQKKAKKLRIYISERDHWRGNSLDNAILDVLRENRMAGATEYRGIQGFGARSMIHTVRQEVMSMDLPVIIEVIDNPEKIDNIIELIYPMVREGLITVEEVEIVKYTHRFMNPLPADKLVSDVMTHDTVTLTQEMKIIDAWKILLKEKVKAAPVINSKEEVIGILTDEDLIDRAGIKQRLSVALRLDSEEISRDFSILKDSPLLVKDIMSHPVVTAGDKDSLGSATSKMVKAGLKRLPVVNQEGKLVGILSRLDILRQVANGIYETPISQIPVEAVRTVSDVMSKNIPLINQDDDLSLIIEKFSKVDSHRLIVIDEHGKAIGLISDSDVVSRVQPEKRRGILDALQKLGKPPYGKETARELMSPGPLTASPDLPVVEAVKLMLADSRKWMVVVNDKGQPLGLVDRQIMLESIAVFENKER